MQPVDQPDPDQGITHANNQHADQELGDCLFNRQQQPARVMYIFPEEVRAQDAGQYRNSQLLKKLAVHFLSEQYIDQYVQQGQQTPSADLEPPVIFA
jgi:hypothetical protein